jgi:hypothetical protein
MIVVGLFRRRVRPSPSTVRKAASWRGEYTKRRYLIFVPITDAEMAVSSANRNSHLAPVGRLGRIAEVRGAIPEREDIAGESAASVRLKGLFAMVACGSSRNSSSNASVRFALAASATNGRAPESGWFSSDGVALGAPAFS